VGNLVEFTSALDHGSYSGKVINERDREEEDAAMTQYRRFIGWFGSRYCLVFGDCWVNSAYLFKKRLADFAATVLEYKTREHSTHIEAADVRGFTPKALHHQLRQHIVSNWDELPIYLDHAIRKASDSLYWTGPTFRVESITPRLLERLGAMDMFEHKEMPSDPLMVTGQYATCPIEIQDVGKGNGVVVVAPGERSGNFSQIAEEVSAALSSTPATQTITPQAKPASNPHRRDERDVEMGRASSPREIRRKRGSEDTVSVASPQHFPQSQAGKVAQRIRQSTPDLPADILRRDAADAGSPPNKRRKTEREGWKGVPERQQGSISPTPGPSHQSQRSLPNRPSNLLQDHTQILSMVKQNGGFAGYCRGQGKVDGD
jgi:hypothetical protein